MIACYNLIFIFIIGYDVEQLFMCLSSIELHWCRVCLYLLLIFTCFLIVEFWEFFKYFRYKSFVGSVICKYFLWIRSLSFQSLNSIFFRAKLFTLLKPYLLTLFFFTDCAFGISLDTLSNQRSQRFSPMTSKFLNCFKF